MEILTYKTCIKCKKVYPIDHFEKKKNEKNFRNVCITCRKSDTKVAQKLKKEWLKNHNMPKLGEPCQCCGDSTKKLVFDHCHKKEEFRGWLCGRCNRAIGMMGDNIEGLQRAINYLRKTNDV